MVFPERWSEGFSIKTQQMHRTEEGRGLKIYYLDCSERFLNWPERPRRRRYGVVIEVIEMVMFCVVFANYLLKIIQGFR